MSLTQSPRGGQTPQEAAARQAPPALPTTTTQRLADRPGAAPAKAPPTQLRAATVVPATVLEQLRQLKERDPGDGAQAAEAMAGSRDGKRVMARKLPPRTAASLPLTQPLRDPSALSAPPGLPRLAPPATPLDAPTLSLPDSKGEPAMPRGKGPADASQLALQAVVATPARDRSRPIDAALDLMLPAGKHRDVAAVRDAIDAWFAHPELAQPPALAALARSLVEKYRPTSGGVAVFLAALGSAEPADLRQPLCAALLDAALARIADTRIRHAELISIARAVANTVPPDAYVRLEGGRPVMLQSRAPFGAGAEPDAAQYLPGFVTLVCERLGGARMSLESATMLLNVFLPEPKEPLLCEFWAGVLDSDTTGARGGELMQAFKRFPRLFEIPSLLATLAQVAEPDGVVPAASVRRVTSEVLQLALQRLAEGAPSLLKQNSEAFGSMPDEDWMPLVAQAQSRLTRSQLLTVHDHFLRVPPAFRPEAIASGVRSVLRGRGAESDLVCAQLALFAETQARLAMQAARTWVPELDVQAFRGVAQLDLPARHKNAMLQGLVTAVLSRRGGEREELQRYVTLEAHRDDTAWAEVQAIHAEMQEPCRALKGIGPLLAPWLIPNLANPELYPDLPAYLGFRDPGRLVQLVLAQPSLIEPRDWRAVEALLARLCARDGHLDLALYARHAETLLLGMVKAASHASRKVLDVGEVFVFMLDAGRHFPAGDRNWARVTEAVVHSHGAADAGAGRGAAPDAGAGSGRRASRAGIVGSASSAGSGRAWRRTAPSVALVPRGHTESPGTDAGRWAVAPAAAGPAAPAQSSEPTTLVPVGKKPGLAARALAFFRR